MKRSFDKGQITRAFERLGPERVARALRTPLKVANWDRCFLASAYGDPGLLSSRVTAVLTSLVLVLPASAALFFGWPWWSFPLGIIVAVPIVVVVLGLPLQAWLLGLTPKQVLTVTSAFDVETTSFLWLAREWLEAHPPRLLRSHAPQAQTAEERPGRVSVLQTAQAPTEARREAALSAP
jgi:hypothetical protein